MVTTEAGASDEPETTTTTSAPGSDTTDTTTSSTDTTTTEGPKCIPKIKKFASGKVINNNYAKVRNYITINKGRNDSVAPDMGVITTHGILGIVENVSNGFATVQSILNEKSKINAKIKNTNHFGSLKWDAERYDVVQLTDVPRLVKLTVGDTVVTGAKSSIFPENIPIGTIQKFDLDTSNSYYTIDLKLFNDMTNIKNVYVIQNKDKEEIMNLEQATEDEQ